jgi:hypothetical protein
MIDEAEAQAALSTLRECYPSDRVLAAQLDGEWTPKTLGHMARREKDYANGMTEEAQTAIVDHYETLCRLHVEGEEALVMALQTVERIESCETMGEVEEATERLGRVLNKKLERL